MLAAAYIRMTPLHQSIFPHAVKLWAGTWQLNIVMVMEENIAVFVKTQWHIIFNCPLTVKHCHQDPPGDFVVRGMPKPEPEDVCC